MRKIDFILIVVYCIAFGFLSSCNESKKVVSPEKVGDANIRWSKDTVFVTRPSGRIDTAIFLQNYGIK